MYWLHGMGRFFNFLFRRRRLKQYCSGIAKLYGVKLTWMRNALVGGDYDLNKRIRISTDCSDQEIITAFCHELAHFVNRVDGKYPIFHEHFHNIFEFFETPIQAVSYAHRAEVYTDKIGKKLCALWFPDVEYQDRYSDPRMKIVLYYYLIKMYDPKKRKRRFRGRTR